MRRREGGWRWWGTGLSQTNVLAWARHMAPAPHVPFPSIDPCFALLSLTFISFSTLVSCIVPLITVSHLISVLVHRNSVFTIPKASYSITGTVTKELLALQDCSPEGFPMLPANYLWYLTILMVLFVPPVGLSLCHLLCPAISQVSCSSFPCSAQSAQSQATT